MQFLNEKIASILVYYPDEGRIIATTGGTTGVDSFAKVYFPEVEWSEFMGVVTMDAIHPTLCMMRKTDGASILCMAAQGKTVEKDGVPFNVVVVFEEQIISQILLSHVTANDGTVIIFDEEKEILKSGDGKLGYHLDGYNGQTEPFKVGTDRLSCMMQVKKSEVFDGYYAIAIPTDYFWGVLKGVRALCLSIALVCMGISVVIAHRASKRSYIPIKSALNRATKYTDQAYDLKEYP